METHYPVTMSEPDLHTRNSLAALHTSELSVQWNTEEATRLVLLNSKADLQN